MTNYTESKQKIDAIRREYDCKGDLIVRTAIQNLVDYGKCTLLDPGWYQSTMDEIDNRHNHAEKEGRFLFCTREFEKAIIDCSVALCGVETYDLLIYIQREVWLGGGPVGEPDYQRAIQLVRKCMGWIENDSTELSDLYDTLVNYCDFDDDEIDYFGFGYLLDLKGED